MVSLIKKYHFILLVVLIGMGLVIKSLYKMKSIDTFAIGEIDHENYTSKGWYRCRYSFSIRNKSGYIRNYNGLYKGLRESRKKHKKTNKYLVGFNSKKPKYSYIFFDIPSDVDLDSLNFCCSPQQFISFWDSITQ